MKGQVYSSSGRDDYALTYYMNAKKLSDKLPYTNPDRSLGYSGLGILLYCMEEYELSIRALLKAKLIREELLGVESIESALIYNNLGCSYLML